jgi:hypothetical protein
LEHLARPCESECSGSASFPYASDARQASLDASADAGFIELARVVNGEVLQSKVTPKFVRLDELNEILARRTYDEAGDFIVSPFAPVLQKNTNANSEDTFVLSLGPGTAFVRGYEIETTEPIKKVVRKGRTTNSANNRTIPTTIGNFVYVVRPAASLPQTVFANTFLVDLHCVNVATINTSSAAVYNQSRIGQAKVRMIETFSVPANTSLQANNTIYRLHFYDVAFDTLTGNVTTGVANGTAITLTIPTGNGLPAGALTNVNDAIRRCHHRAQRYSVTCHGHVHCQQLQRRERDCGIRHACVSFFQLFRTRTRRIVCSSSRKISMRLRFVTRP